MSTNWIKMTERFARIRKFYVGYAPEIMAEPSDWGLMPYEWEEAGVQFTPIESALWQDIRMEDLVLYPQYPVDRFFVDFGNPVWKVAIECDGAAWHLDKDKDAARDAALNKMGWLVYRISGKDCRTDYAEVEDEYGRVKLQPGAARLFIRGVVAAHPEIKRGWCD